MRIKTLLLVLAMIGFGFVSSVLADDKVQNNNAVQKGLDQFGIRKMTPEEEAQAKKAAEPKTSSTEQTQTASAPSAAKSGKPVSPAVQKGLDQYGVRKMTPEEEAKAKQEAGQKTALVPQTASPQKVEAAKKSTEPYKDFAHTNESLVGERVGDGPGVTPGRWIHNRADGLDPQDAFDATITKADGTKEVINVGPGEWAWIPDGAKQITIHGGDATSRNGGSIYEGDPKFWGHPDQEKHFKRIDGFVADRKGEDVIINEKGKAVQDDDEDTDGDDESNAEDMKWISSHASDARDTQFNEMNTWNRPDQAFNLGFPDTIPTLSRNFGTPVQEANRDQQ